MTFIERFFVLCCLFGVFIISGSTAICIGLYTGK